MNYRQRTISKQVSCCGVGVHSGNNVNLTIKPAHVNHGIKFVRTDLPGRPKVNALYSSVVDTSLATVIGSEGVIVSTIEHLMASFSGLSIDNALVELDSYELPILDGSASYFTKLIMDSGFEDQTNPRCFFVIRKPIEIKQDGRSVGVYPSSSCQITCTIDFEHPLIKTQSFSIDLSDKEFSENISDARTFGFLKDYETLKRYDLARGASLETGVVMDNNDILNKEGLRYDDEFVRHKLLDCMGDFALLGMPILGHIVAHKSGHAFNHAFLKEFLDRKDSWETLPLNSTEKTHQFGSLETASL